MDLDIKPAVKAGLFGSDKSTVQEIADGAKGLIAIKFSAEEVAAITVVIGIFLRAVGLQGMLGFVQLLLQLQQAKSAASETSATVAQK